MTRPVETGTASDLDSCMPVAIATSTADVLLQVRQLQAHNQPTDAFNYLLGAVRGNGWKKSKLWWRLVSLMTSPQSYQAIRDLWLESPATCHENASILRAVARAAAISDNHLDCRLLLRKLILLQSRGSKRSSKLRHTIPGAILPRRKAHKQRAETDNVEQSHFASQAADALVDLNEDFASLGLKTFLISGTLLGQVREGHIIGWDKDIDVGYFHEECSVDLESHFRKSSRFRVGRVDLTSTRLRLIHKNGVWIDVFPHYMEKGLRWHDGTATRWWNTPFGLRRINFIGIDQYIPDNPELYLKENYGDWRIPNSNFDARIDAPNVEITDPDHFNSLLYFSLEKCLRGNKKIMKNRYVKILQKQCEGAWVDYFL